MYLCFGWVIFDFGFLRDVMMMLVVKREKVVQEVDWVESVVVGDEFVFGWFYDCYFGLFVGLL